MTDLEPVHFFDLFSTQPGIPAPIFKFCRHRYPATQTNKRHTRRFEIMVPQHFEDTSSAKFQGYTLYSELDLLPGHQAASHQLRPAA